MKDFLKYQDVPPKKENKVVVDFFLKGYVSPGLRSTYGRPKTASLKPGVYQHKEIAKTVEKQKKAFIKNKFPKKEVSFQN